VNNPEHSDAHEPRLQTGRPWTALAVVIFVIIAGAVLAQLSLTLHPRFLKLDDSVASQKAIFERTPAHFDGVTDDIANWRNRVIIPYWLEGLTRATHLSYHQSYVLTRWLTASLALAAFMFLVCRVLPVSVFAAAGAACWLIVSLVPCFLHIYEIPSDFLDAAFFSLLALYALQRRHLAFAVTLFIGLLNRESAIFALFLWFALYAFAGGWPRFLRECTWCGVLGVVGTALVTYLRIVNADHAGANGLQTFAPAWFFAYNLGVLREWIAHPNFIHPYFYFGGYLALLTCLLAGQWRNLPRPMGRVFLAAGFIFLISVMSNNLDELRSFIPSLVLTTLVIISIAVRQPARTVSELPAC